MKGGDNLPNEIKLANGKGIALVDDEDYEIHGNFNWYKSSHGYVCRKVRRNGRRETLFLHREIMGAKKGEKVDHINRDRLNCQRQNLRFATSKQNNQNRSPRKGTSSRFKGVCWHKSDKAWYASIKVDNKSIHLGRFKNEEDAARAYNDAAYIYFGEFAYLNKTMLTKRKQEEVRYD